MLKKILIGLLLVTSLTSLIWSASSNDTTRYDWEISEDANEVFTIVVDDIIDGNITSGSVTAHIDCTIVSCTVSFSNKLVVVVDDVEETSSVTLAIDGDWIVVDDIIDGN